MYHTLCNLIPIRKKHKIKNIFFCKPRIKCNKIYKKNSNYYSSAAKFTVILYICQKIDDKILINDSDGLKLYENNILKALYKQTNNSFTHINDSRVFISYFNNQNGELILASANEDPIATIIWKYKRVFDSFEIPESQFYSDLIMGKFSNNNKNILGINMDLNINVIDTIYDVNYTTIIREYKNNEANSYDLHNTIELNMDDSLMLYNRDLYCIRSGIKIHTFDKLTRHSAGIFMPVENSVLISNYLFDLRTLQVLDSIEHLKNTVVKRTYNDNILLGCKVEF
ncbi:hypothetical protein HZS_4260 [Henneguya salminicola]|nr:hypothetical protein HZS_4260 [Henneguya salminicola]